MALFELGLAWLANISKQKRRRREYRQMRKEQFKRPESGLSMYEGRTRGKRMKYTYSDDEMDFLSDSTNRRSTRNTRNHTPAEPAGPVVTASGRQIRAPTRLNIETRSNGGPSAAPSVAGDALNGDMDMEDNDLDVGPTGRPRQSAAVHHGTNGWAQKKRKSNEYESDEEEDDGSEPDFGDDEEEDDHVPEESDEDEEEFDDEEIPDDELAAGKTTLVVKLPVKAAINGDGQSRISCRRRISGEKHRYSRAAHRNVVVSEESSADSDVPPSRAPEEKPIAEEIASCLQASQADHSGAGSGFSTGQQRDAGQIPSNSSQRPIYFSCF